MLSVLSVLSALYSVVHCAVCWGGGLSIISTPHLLTSSPHLLLTPPRRAHQHQSRGWRSRGAGRACKAHIRAHQDTGDPLTCHGRRC
ncbi:hypothetical protein B484DRAFT_453782 [Ochromonadaceae sp. CCMP2298]|nr:hypothetical protein B484DRAFT_453782 [Ochromonadaceae sp. CCMP2298]